MTSSDVKTATDYVTKYMLFFALIVILTGVIIGLFFILQNINTINTQQEILQSQDTAIKHLDYLINEQYEDKIEANIGRDAILIETRNVLESISNTSTELAILLAFLNYEDRLLTKEIMDYFNITIPDAKVLNKRHHDYPYYYTNQTHLIIDTNTEENMTIAIPKEMTNLMMQFKNQTLNPLHVDITTNN